VRTPSLAAVLLLSAAAAACNKGDGKDAPKPAPAPTSTTPTTAPSPTAPSPTTPAAPAAPSTPSAGAASHGDVHDVYSLVDNRLSAHLTRGGGLLVPAGSAGFAKYTRFGNLMKGAKRAWELRQTEGDVKVARIVGKSATLFVPVTTAQAAKGTVRLRVHSEHDGTVSLKVNDGKDINGKVPSGWSTVELDTKGQLKDGENSLALFMKASGAEVAWVQVGGEMPVGDDGATKFYDTSTKSLVIPKDGAMTWFVAVPDKATLVADVSCTVKVTATADDGATAGGQLVPGGKGIDLAAVAGKAVRLELAPAGCDAQIANAALAQPGPQATAKRGEPPKHVLFIVMDALRADRVRAFNPKARPESPNFDKLVADSTLFENDYVQGNESQVSHASIWSSNYLAKHHAIEMQDKLADKWTTIDEVAHHAHMYTVGESGNGYIRPSRGFGSGWDQFTNHIEKELGLKGADIVEKGMGYIEKKKDQPWFLYLGLIDTHVTWRAKQPWMGKYDGGYKGRFATEYGDDGPNASDGKDLTEKEKDHVRALYDSNVSYQDELVGQIIDKLKAWGVYDSTMLVITADHGDEQWEDGRVGHGGSERETLLHVPLVIHYPPMFPAGKIYEGTESIDITPTIADALGQPQDPEWQGMSLVPLANGQGGYALMSSSSQYENMHAGRIGHWKIKLVGGGAPKLYDLAKDPGEHDDLWGKASAEIGARLTLDPMWMLRNWNTEWKQAQWGTAGNVSNRFAADLGE
jgi:arylsulfatase A-like enzyme